jgi:hypothetical protein
MRPKVFRKEISQHPFIAPLPLFIFFYFMSIIFFQDGSPIYTLLLRDFVRQTPEQIGNMSNSRVKYKNCEMNLLNSVAELANAGAELSDFCMEFFTFKPRL